MDQICYDARDRRGCGKRMRPGPGTIVTAIFVWAALVSGCASSGELAPVPKAVLAAPGGASWEIEYDEANPAETGYPEAVMVVTITESGQRIDGLVFDPESIPLLPEASRNAYRFTVPHYLKYSQLQGWRLHEREAVVYKQFVENSAAVPLWIRVPVIHPERSSGRAATSSAVYGEGKER